MLNKKIFIPLALITTAIFAIGYGVTIKKVPFENLFSSSTLLDTLDTPPEPQTKDVSQMFNERGFYKSNGFTADESEIINNFNGNLMFSIPLYKSAGRNGVDLDIKLNYNGSVGHTVILSTEQNYININALNIRKYNINSPEWILSVNGIGVQTFNFEDRMLTQPTGSEVAGNDVKKLIPGYHFDDRLRPSGSTDKDRITILMGDGSTITLINSDPVTSGSYVGLYRGEGKGSHIIANVFYDETDPTTTGNYKNRYVELMMGDGLQYVFREYKFDYRDVTVGANMENSRKPQILLLEKIRDMFGVYINFMYDLSFSGKGRPKLLSVGGYKDVFELYYGNLPGGASNGVLITNIHQGTFRFLFDEFTYINGSGGNKTGTITTIKNPVNNSAVISYTNYQRKLTNVPYQQSQKTINCDNLKRITEFNNFLGGKRIYSYLGTANMEINATLNIMRSTTDFKGYGRDPFYTNMIIDKTDYFGTNIHKSYSSFDYPFTDAGGDFDNNNYDPNDYYATDVKIESRNSTTVNESQNLWNLYKYKIYPARTSSYSANENFDIEGQTKLITEETKQPDGNVYSKNDYEYDIATCNTFCPGSFLMTKRTNTIGNQSRVWDYLYRFDGNFYDSTLTEKVEIDPNGFKTKNTFLKFFKEIWYLDSDHGPSGPIDTLSFLEANTYYKLDMPVDQKRYNKSSNRTEYPENDISAGLLSFTKNVYCEDTIHVNAYIGQLLSTRVYNEQNFTQYIHTDYEYYKKDPIGKALYNPGRLPFVEGNLKRVLKENSQEERYFYFPISNGQNQLFEETDDIEGALPLPEISYKIKRNNGTVILKKDVFLDTRMPVRIDKYKRINSNTVDTISIINMRYNNAGKPSIIVNENGFATQMEYDYTYNRIRAITLPGDFSDQESYDQITVNTITADTTMLIRSTAIGYLDLSSGTNPRFLYSHAMRWHLMLKMFDDNQSEFKYHPFIKYDFNNLNSFNSISAATLRIAPLTYTLLTGTQQNPLPINNGYSVNFKPAYGHGTTTVYDLQYADLNPQYYSYSKNNIIGPYPVNSWGGNTNVCNFDEHINNANVKPIIDYLKNNDKNLYGIILSPQKTGQKNITASGSL